MRRTFTLPREVIEELTDKIAPVPGDPKGHGPKLQLRVNAFWDLVADNMGFVPNTVESWSGAPDYSFTAELPKAKNDEERAMQSALAIRDLGPTFRQSPKDAHVQAIVLEAMKWARENKT